MARPPSPPPGRAQKRRKPAGEAPIDGERDPSLRPGSLILLLAGIDFPLPTLGAGRPPSPPLPAPASPCHLEEAEVPLPPPHPTPGGACCCCCCGCCSSSPFGWGRGDCTRNRSLLGGKAGLYGSIPASGGHLRAAARCERAVKTLLRGRGGGGAGKVWLEEEESLPAQAAERRVPPGPPAVPWRCVASRTFPVLPPPLPGSPLRDCLLPAFSPPLGGGNQCAASALAQCLGRAEGWPLVGRGATSEGRGGSSAKGGVCPGVQKVDSWNVAGPSSPFPAIQRCRFCFLLASCSLFFGCS